jgi:hypothetical protein
MHLHDVNQSHTNASVGDSIQAWATARVGREEPWELCELWVNLRWGRLRIVELSSTSSGSRLRLSLRCALETVGGEAPRASQF